MLDGNYAAAIPTLRRALRRPPPSSLTYAYALYDLGRALLLSGDPKAAIPVLEQRLKIPNQTAGRQQTLNQALQAAGRRAPAAPDGRAGAHGHHGHGRARAHGGHGQRSAGQRHADGHGVGRTGHATRGARDSAAKPARRAGRSAVA